MNLSWIFKMAWRDSRKNKSRMFLFISSIIFGIASLVSINSFNHNLEIDINQQAAELIGADLELSSNRKLSDEGLGFVDSLKLLSEEFAIEQRFMTMLRLPSVDASRFVQVRAVQGKFPFYGKIETLPSKSFDLFGKKNGLFIENSMFLQYEQNVGDTIFLGKKAYPIMGGIMSQPNQTSFVASFAPTVIVPLDQLQGAGLQQTGSRIEYHYYFKFPKNFDVESQVETLKDKITTLQLRSSTIESTKENTGKSFEDITNFMELIGFVALLLGCIGVSSAVQIYIKEKLLSVAILRCLGATAKQAFFIFLLQFAVIGFIGSIIGALLGTAIQFGIPMILQDILPVKLTTQIVWSSIIEGISIGTIISVLFALLPLLSIRRISPLNSLRIREDSEPLNIEIYQVWIYIAIATFILCFARLQMNNWIQTILFCVCILAIFLLLFGIAKAFIWVIHRYFPHSWPYLWRQGLSNLWRPNNQTVVLVVSISLATSMIATLFFVQEILLRRVTASADQSQANMLMFDIQPSQSDSLQSLIEREGFKVIERVPVVTMSIDEINGKTLPQIMDDSTSQISRKAFRHEIRATYRDSLTLTEKLTKGVWIGKVQDSDTASISIDKSYASSLGIDIGDVLSMNVQGAIIPAKINSLREVEWNRFQSNFRMVFAKGSIDHAPQFFLMTTLVSDVHQIAKIQQKIVSNFPNVSVIDMQALREVLNDILEKMSFVIQFMGSFSILTGIIVLISSVRISKYQRLQENVLLRTLGASSKQIFLITTSEYLFLGLISSISGLLISLFASNILAVFVFESVFVPDFSLVIKLVVAIISTTVIIGLLNNLNVIWRSPLEVLRSN